MCTYVRKGQVDSFNQLNSVLDLTIFSKSSCTIHLLYHLLLLTYLNCRHMPTSLIHSYRNVFNFFNLNLIFNVYSSIPCRYFLHLICTTPLSHQHLTCIWPVTHLHRTCFSPASYPYFTCIWPVTHLYLTCFFPASYLYFTSIWPVSHLYLTCFFPVSHLYFTCRILEMEEATEEMVLEQLAELQTRELIMRLDNGGYVRHVLDKKTGGAGN